MGNYTAPSTKLLWLATLNRSYNISVNDNGTCESKAEFLSGEIFNFTTYDGLVDEKIVGDMMEVIIAIYNKKTFDFIATDEGYLKYITCINMSWLIQCLDWGCSVRGAWFDEYMSSGIDIGFLYNEKEEHDYHKTTTNIVPLIEALIEFWNTKEESIQEKKKHDKTK